ncbi:MAG: ATP-binding protein [Kiritimatiellia bacterium]
MKPGFLDRLMDRLDRLDPESLQTYFVRLAQEKGLLETIFQAIQEGLLVLDAEGRINYMNRAAGELLGLSPDAVKGQPVSKHLRELDWNKLMGLDSGAWSRLVRQEMEVTYPRHRIVNFYIVPLALVEKRASGAVMILRDVTPERESAAFLVESERLNAIRLLAAGVAHEIGNPLNALTIHLQLLERDLQGLPDDDRRKSLAEMTAIARSEVTRLDAIITQFLRAIRPSRPQLAPTRLEAVLQETLTLLKQDIENRGITVNLDLHEPLPSVPADREQVKQAFFNVIKNALEALTSGGEIAITVSANEQDVEVAFQDNGAGVDPEAMGRLFEPYFTTKSTGNGLGLMIVQRIVQEHGGRVEITSEPGKGTAVILFLPLHTRRLRLPEARPDTGPRSEKGND